MKWDQPERGYMEQIFWSLEGYEEERNRIVDNSIMSINEYVWECHHISLIYYDASLVNIFSLLDCIDGVFRHLYTFCNNELWKTNCMHNLILLWWLMNISYVYTYGQLIKILDC